MIPGYAQWCWDQHPRAVVLFGSYLAALGVGAFAWGTPVGLLVLAFAYGTHVASATDVIRQQAFPGFGRWVPAISTSGGLGLGLYGPALVLASLVAWPVMRGDGTREGYLVNCRTYTKAAPQHGDWVWLRSSPWNHDRLGRVIAGPGQEVEWSDEQLRVDGTRRSPGMAPSSLPWPGALVFRVPADHALIAPVQPRSARTTPDRPLLLPCSQVLGRVWAKAYPILDRRLLR